MVSKGISEILTSIYWSEIITKLSLLHAVKSLTEVHFKHLEAGSPLIEANDQSQVAGVISEVGGQCVLVDEQLKVNTTTDAGANLVKATQDVLANSTPNVNTLCQC